MTFEEARRRLLEQAAELEIDLEVLATSSRELRVDARDGQASDIGMSSSGGLGLRVIRNGRTGYAWTEELTDEALEWTLSEAVANAELQEPEQTASLPVGTALGRHDLLDEGLSAPLQDKKDAAISLERALMTDARVQALQVARYSENQSETEISSTRGVSGSYRAGHALLLTSLVMREGDSVKQGYSLDASTGFHALEPGRTAQQALTEVSRHLGARPLKTGRRRAIFEPDVTAALLGLLLQSLSGKNLAEGKSLLADRLGERIASEAVTLVDDPFFAGGLANRPFDAEGTPAERLVIIDNGVFRSFLHNSDTASRTGQRNTGHASRSYRSTLSVGPSNLILESGSGVTRADGTIIITDVMGVHAGANPITGDVSIQAMGLEVAGGELTPVDNFAIAFNLFRLLEQIEEVGDDPEWRPGFAGIVRAPSISVADLSFAGS